MSSSQNQLIIELVVKDMSTGQIRALDTALKDVDATAKQAKADLQNVGAGADASIKKANDSTDLFRSKLDGIGRRDFSRAMTGAFLGIDAALTAMGEKADADTKRLIEMGRASEQVGLAFAFGGPVGGALAALGVGIGVLISYMKQEHDETVRVVNATDDYIIRLRNAANATEAFDASNKGLAQSMRAYADMIAEAETRVKQAQDAANQGTGEGADYARKNLQALRIELANLKEAYDTSYAEAEHARAGMYDHAAAADADAAASKRAADAVSAYQDAQLKSMYDTRAEAIKDHRESAADIAAWKTEQEWGNKEFVPGLGWVPKDYQTIVNQARQAAQQLQDQVKGMVDAAMKPTDVTAEDLKAADQGKYITKWDEFRRRAEAVLAGTDPMKYGEKFVGALQWVEQQTGMTLDQIDQKFKDFSLFATLDVGEAIKHGVVDLGPIEAQVNEQIDSMIGHAKLLAYAFDDIWSKMSQQKKADLAKALGLSANATEQQIQQALTNPAKAQVDGLATYVASLKPTISIYIKKSNDFDSVYGQIKKQLENLLGPYTFRVTVTGGGGEGGGGGSSPAVVPTPTGGGVPMQHGGFGVLSHDTLISAHAGEGYLFTGSPMRAPFASMFAAAAGATYTDSHALNINGNVYVVAPSEAELRRKLLGRARNG